MVGYLTDVFQNRFGRPVEIRVKYQEAKESSLKHNEVRLQQEIDAICEHAASVQEEKARKQEEKEAKQEKKEAAKGGAKAAVRGNKRQKGILWKRKTDGYGFRNEVLMIQIWCIDETEEEAIELRQVVTEMGEITIRGKVISFDTREIRNEKTIVMYAVTDLPDTVVVNVRA